MSEVWGRTGEELVNSSPKLVDTATMRNYLGNHIRVMLQDGESESIILQWCSDRIKAAEQPALFTTPVLTKQINAHREILAKAGKLPEQKRWLCDADEFMQRDLETREPLLIDVETGSTVLYEKSLNQVFAYRGIGKSVVANALIKVLTQGGNFLRFRSDGRCRTVLVDGELPAVQLQEGLKEFSGTPQGLLKILSPELMPNPKAFPVLSVPSQQAAFLEQIEDYSPHVLIFDTLTRCFKFDTNDPDAWLVVNDFLLDLRFRGYCVILIHHAGKNGTQRGRTDGDDNLDVSVVLSPRYGWQPGDGLQFKWTYEKVRHGGHLPEFEAEYNPESRTWQTVQDNRTAEIVELAAKGKTQRAIALSLDMSPASVNRVLKRARQQGLLKLNEKHG